MRDNYSAAFKDAINHALEDYGFKVVKCERIILGWGPTITNNYEIEVAPIDGSDVPVENWGGPGSSD